MLFKENHEFIGDLSTLMNQGLYVWIPGDPVLEIIIADDESRTNLYQPTLDEFLKACADYNISGHDIVESMKDAPDFHTLVIDAPTYLASREEKSNE